MKILLNPKSDAAKIIAEVFGFNIENISVETVSNAVNSTIWISDI